MIQYVLYSIQERTHFAALVLLTLPLEFGDFAEELLLRAPLVLLFARETSRLCRRCLLLFAIPFFFLFSQTPSNTNAPEHHFNFNRL